MLPIRPYEMLQPIGNEEKEASEEEDMGKEEEDIEATEEGVKHKVMREPGESTV